MTYTEEQYNAVLTSTAAALQAKDIECASAVAAITAERDRVAKLLADARAAWDSRDLSQIAALAAAADMTAKQKELAEKLAAKAALEAEIAALKA